MRKLLAVFMLAALLCVSFALADGEICGIMEVVNCKEWVSLREQPSTEAERLAQVPLHARVRNGLRVSSDFWRVTYDDQTGYILAKYLRSVLDEPLQEEQAGVIPYKELLAGGDVVFRHETADQREVIAALDFSEGECLRIGCYNTKDHTAIWGYTTLVRETTELYSLKVFLGGSAEYPMIMVYNCNIGLTALNLYDGTPDWKLSAEQCPLGGSICYAVAEDGTMYIAGYYGPDPVCIGMDGEVRWRTSTGSDEIYWPYRVRLQEGCIVTCYESCMETDCHYEVTYGLDGAVLKSVVTAEWHEDIVH